MPRLSGRERREMLRYEPIPLPNGTVDVRTPTGKLFQVDPEGLLVYLQFHIPDVSACHSPRLRYFRPMFDPCPLFLYKLSSNSPKNLVSR